MVQTKPSQATGNCTVLSVLYYYNHKDSCFIFVLSITTHVFVLFIHVNSNFLSPQKALEDLGLRGDEICDILKIVAAVLKLGNIQFVPTTNMDGTEGCGIANEYGELDRLTDRHEKQ